MLERILSYLPGWILMILVGLLAEYFSGLITVAGKHPLEASIVGILLGMAIGNFKLVLKVCAPGVKAYEKLLVLGIVLMGATLKFSDLASHGASYLEIVSVVIVVGLLVTFFVGRAFKLSQNLSVLLAVGTCICGGTAIAVIAPIIKAKDEETSYAVGVISLWGLIAILVYPAIAHIFAVSDLDFGVFAGTAVHSTPQVLGAGFSYSELAGNTATTVKLIRNCFIAPLAFLIAAWTAKIASVEDKKAIRKAFPWFLFGYFVMAGIASLEVVNASTLTSLSDLGKKLIIISMVGVGLSTNFSSFKSVGIKPLIVGLIGALVLAGVSILLIRQLL